MTAFLGVVMLTLACSGSGALTLHALGLWRDRAVLDRMALSYAIGFGVVGLGMGKSHCRSIAAAHGARLVAVCDIDPDRLRPTAEEHGVKAYDSYADMLQDSAVDVVSIATPSGMHTDMGLQAAEAGKHMLIEKPVGVKVADIQLLAQRVRTAGLRAATVFQSRTLPLNRRIKTAIDSGRLGRLIGVHAILPWYRKQNYYEGAHGAWKGTWAMDGGGSLMNQGVHTVDLLQWLAGPVQSVFGAFGVFAHSIEAEDKTVACLRFRNGALGTLTTTTAAFSGSSRIVVIHGDRGTIHTESDLVSWRLMDDVESAEEREMLTFYGAKGKRPEGETIASDPMGIGSTGHTFHVEDLVSAIREKRDPYITVEDAMHAVQIINAIYASGRCGSEVSIDAE